MAEGHVAGLGPGDFTRDLVRWSETLAGIARTGMGFTESLYERERYEEVLQVASDIKMAADDALEARREPYPFIQEWMAANGEGGRGSVTPKGRARGAREAPTRQKPPHSVPAPDCPTRHR